jgi:hypothetical protein
MLLCAAPGCCLQLSKGEAQDIVDSVGRVQDAITAALAIAEKVGQASNLSAAVMLLQFAWTGKQHATGWQ